LGRELGGFDLRFRYYPDIDFWYRSLLRRPGLRLDARLCDFRVHDNSQSTARRAEYVTEYETLLALHAATAAPSAWERNVALLRAHAVGRARSLVIEWILRSAKS
jgi:hypothetical protein